MSSARRSAGAAHGATAGARVAVRERLDRDPASRRISRPRAWNVRTRTVPAPLRAARAPRPAARVSSSAARLLNAIAAIGSGGVPVARARRRGRRASSSCRAGRGEAQHGTRRRRRGGALVGRKAGEPFGDGGVPRSPSINNRGRTLARALQSAGRIPPSGALVAPRRRAAAAPLRGLVRPAAGRGTWWVLKLVRFRAVKDARPRPTRPAPEGRVGVPPPQPCPL